jgi:VIT1/CCC1 family predicted Fe2+/Mn2+ transporter
MMGNILKLQQEERNGQIIYARLAKITKDEHNRKILERIAGEEEKHYQIWKKYTQQDTPANWLKTTTYYWMSRLLGITFGVKLMELGEESTQAAYEPLLKEIPEIRQMHADEEKHEEELLGMLDEESLRYAGSVVLGLNDALVELTGALAGLTFAFQNTKIIALAGLITGISASFSMAASEYLSNKAEGGEQDPVKSAVYTGIAYIFTVAVLVLPYLLVNNYLVSLGWTIVNAILIIAAFNYYLSVAKSLDFKRRFLEMALISLGVAFLSFIIGNLIRIWFGIEI